MDRLLSTLASISSQGSEAGNGLADAGARRVAGEDQSDRLHAATRNAIALAETRMLGAIGLMAQEVNATFNDVAAQQSVQGAMAQAIARIETRLTADHGALANEMNATLNSVSEQRGGLASMADAVARIEAQLAADDELVGALGLVAQEVNATLNIVAAQQAVQDSMAEAVGRLERASNLQIGPLANEVNATLNMVAAQQAVQGSMAEAVNRIEAEVATKSQRPLDSDAFKQVVLAAARNVSQRGDHRQITPYTRQDVRVAGRALKIGLFGNMANQAYIMAKCLRRLGHEVDVIIQADAIDVSFVSQPFWEETEIEVQNAGVSQPVPNGWKASAFVREISYDVDSQLRYQNRLDAVPEVQALYRQLTDRTLPDDVALLLAQWMGQWNYIKTMNDYDVVHLSTWPVVLGVFCPKPYVVGPLGGELYVTAFQEDVQGLLCRAAFRSADRISIPETDYPNYLDRLETLAPRSFMPLMVDTDVYQPGPNDQLRADWHAKVGGTRYILSVCRQSWTWKGSDRLIRAFAAFHLRDGGEWRLLLQAWGDDVERSRALVTELGIDRAVLWLPMCSKPLLRLRQRAADVVADQFVMEGYGTSVLESMAAGKAIVMSPVPREAEHHFKAGPPPFVGARTEGEIMTALQQLTNDTLRLEIGSKSRRWIEEEHGYRALEPRYISMFKEACAWDDEGQAHKKSPEPIDTTLNTMFEEHRKRRDKIREKWDRTLPFAEQITDRWEKARYLNFGDGASIYDSALVIGDVSVGEKTWIGPDCVLDGSGGLQIGSTCSISAGCQLYSHDTVAWAVSGGKADTRRAETSVGDAVYIGPGTIVASGSAIGDHSIIGALSFVNGKIPPYSFAVGSPARIIGRVTIDSRGEVSIQADQDADKRRSASSEDLDKTQ